MANKKISQLETIADLSGNEDLLVALNFINYRIKTRRLADAIGSTLINKVALGLSNVDNTSDSNKPVSTAMQLALNAKSDTVHTHTIASIDTLQTVLDGLADGADKANTLHSHGIEEITGLTQALIDKANAADLSAKADIGHGHSVSDITGLDAALLEKATLTLLANKAAVGHVHPEADITGLSTALDDKANLTDVALKSDTVHTHIPTDVNGLNVSLSLKSDAVHIHPLNDIVGAQDLITALETQFAAVEQIPNVKGPSLIYIGDVGNYLITNYDSYTPLTITTTNGVIDRTEDTFVYTPDSAGIGGFTINGKEFVITILNKVINTPAVTSPIDQSTEISLNTALTASAFATSPANEDTHVDSDWELATDSIFSSIIQSSYNDAVNKTSWSVTGLLENTVYYVRVKYRGAVLTSDWSSIVSFTTVASVMPINEQFIITAPDKAAGDKLGYSVSVAGDGSRIVVGAYFADPSTVLDAGKAYIFLKTGITWSQEAILNADTNISSEAGFGISVSMDNTGSRVVVGEYKSDPGTVTDAGRAYVFIRTGTSWSQEAQLIASDVVASNQFWANWFGYSVSMNQAGDRLIVGAYLYGPTGANSAVGKAYVFVRSGSVWSEEAILYASDGADFDRFGYRVLMAGSGDRVVIGAYSANPGGLSGAGKVYVFSRTGTVWTEEAILTASDATAGDSFGVSISADALCERIAVGAILKDTLTTTDHGAVYVFLRTGTVWTEEAILFASDQNTDLIFGIDVSLNGIGDGLAISSAGPLIGTETLSGEVYYFTRSGSVWTEQAVFRATDTLSDDDFGRSLALSNDGNTLVIGADRATAGGLLQAGKAYIYG